MQCPHHLILVNPHDFSYNSQTAESNSFQHNVKANDINLLVKSEFENVLNVLKDNNISISTFDSPENSFVPDAVFPNNWFAVLPSGELIIFWLISMKLMIKMDKIKPKSNAPVSPIKIRAGVKLYFKNATTAPANENAIIA